MLATRCTRQPHWPLLEAFPLANVGKLLSSNELHIAIALWTSTKIFESTESSCGKIVDKLGLHGLSCIKNAGRFPRPSAISSILKGTITHIKASLYLGARRLDKGWKEAWWIDTGPLVQKSKPSMGRDDCDLLCSVPPQNSAIESGTAATETEFAKSQKDNDLLNNYCFQQGLWNGIPSDFGWLEPEPKTFRWWSRSLKLGSGSTDIICGASELYK